MKHILSLVVLLAVATTVHADLTIISTEHRDADSFKRISEYLTGKPSDGRYTVFRSDDSSRDGFYVSLLASEKSILESVSTVRLQFVRSGTQEIDTFEAPAGDIKKKRILVGLTGNEWLEKNSRPIAWKIDLLDASGNSLESSTSFLWSE